MNAMGNKNPEMGNTHPEYSCDWGHGNKCVFYDGVLILDSAPKNVRDFLKANSPCILYIESAFESYHNETYNETLKLANSLGSQIFTISSRKTDRLRRVQGLEKSDTVDAVLIWEIAHSNYHLKTPTSRVLRRLGRLEKANNDRRAFDYTDSNPSWIEAKNCLPSYASLEPWMQDVLGDGKKYAAGFVTPIVQCALSVLDNGGNRDDFDKLLGTYAHGFPSYTRAAIFNKANGRISSLVRRDIKAGLDEEESLKNRMRQVRKATRFIFNQASATTMGNPHPETGN